MNRAMGAEPPFPYAAPPTKKSGDDLAIAAGCFPGAWCGNLAGSVSAKGAVSFKPGAAPQDFDSDEQALKARVNSIT